MALVTGGAQGIGRAIAKLLADNGSRVAIVDINLEAAQETVREIESSGGTALSVEGDVSSAPQMTRALDQILEKWDRLSILINNAGINTLGGRVPIHEFAEEDWEQILKVDLTGVYIVSKVSIPALKRCMVVSCFCCYGERQRQNNRGAENQLTTSTTPKSNYY